MDAGCGGMVDTRVLVELGSHVEITPELKAIASRYSVPVEVLAAIKARNYERLARAFRTANNFDYAKIALVKREVELLGKLVGFNINTRGDDVYITLAFPTVRVVWKISAEEWGKHSEDEWYEMLREWWYVKARRVETRVKRGGREVRREAWVAEKARVVRIEADIEAYKRLEEKLDRIPALFALLGYDPDKILSHPASLLILTRIIQVITPEPVHALELTVPGTGKTTTAIKLNYALGWHYFNEPPSVASLVGDARTGRAIIASARGLWLDEIDKWNKRSGKREAIAEIIEVLLTGMEQGVWRRSKGGEKQIQVFNAVPVRFTGNVYSAVDPRAYLVQEFSRSVGDGGAKALEDRIGIAIVAAKQEYAEVIQEAAMENITARAGVLRGAVQFLHNEWYKTYRDVETKLKGRRARAAKRIATTIAVLAKHDDPSTFTDIAEKLVMGVSDPEELWNELALSSRRDA